MVKEINKDNFKESLKGKCVVDFFATWCPPCRMIAPIFEELSEEMTDVSFYKVNIDENSNLAVENDVTHVPTLIVFEDEVPTNRVTGYIDKDKLKEFIGGSK